VLELVTNVFTRALYLALAEGKTVHKAFINGKVAVISHYDINNQPDCKLEGKVIACSIISVLLLLNILLEELFISLYSSFLLLKPKNCDCCPKLIRTTNPFLI